MVSKKQCSKCRESKPATIDFFARDKSKSDGLQVQCKVCQKVYRAENAVRISEYNRTYREENAEKLADYRCIEYAANKEIYAERARVYREKNAERIAARARHWYAGHSEVTKRRARNWRMSNRARYLELHRDRERHRNFLKSMSEGQYTVDDVKRQYDKQGGKCLYCSLGVGDKYHVDHFIPLSRGGSNGADNIVIACPGCNQSKHDKLPHEWAKQTSQGSTRQ